MNDDARSKNPGRSGNSLEQTPDELAKEVNRLRALLVAVPDLIIRLHRDGTYLDFVGAKDIPVLVPKHERIHRNVKHVLPENIASIYLRATQTALETSETQTFQYELPIAGKVGHYEARVVKSGNDEVLMVVRDVTERHLAEEALRREKEHSEQILLNILPRKVVEELKQTTGTISHRFDSATVLFADIVGFTQATSMLPPSEVVETLNRIFTSFDVLAERHGLEKIKTIGDAYMAVGGVPVPQPHHAAAVADMALEMQTIIKEFAFPGQPPLALRIGMATGPVVAGVIGVRKFIYDLWGDTVNVASRMESSGEPGRIQVEQSTFEMLQSDYRLEPRGRIPIKGKGVLSTYFLLGK
jgi:urea transport system substrate-binding protein